MPAACCNPWHKLVALGQDKSSFGKRSDGSGVIFIEV